MEYAIIAAGEGSRLAREGVPQPKPLVPVNGEPLIDRLCRIFMQNDASRIHIITHNRLPEVQCHIEKLQQRYPIRLIVKNTPSSMHSFYELAAGITAEQFCLTTVDTLFDEQEFAHYIEAFQQADATDAYMAVTDFVDDEKPLYIETDDALHIRAFCDEPTAQSRYVSGGIYAFTQAVIPVLKHGIESGMSRMRNFQRSLLTAGMRVDAHPFSCIVDIDHAADIAKAETFILTHKRPLP